jgi:hypothetical protein
MQNHQKPGWDTENTVKVGWVSTFGESDRWGPTGGTNCSNKKGEANCSNKKSTAGRLCSEWSMHHLLSPDVR